MEGRFRVCGSFVPQYERYDAANRLLPLIWEEQERQSKGYFLVINAERLAWLMQTADRFLGYIDALVPQISLYLLADEMLYPVGIGAFSDDPLLLSAAFTSGSGTLGYGLELV